MTIRNALILAGLILAVSLCLAMAVRVDWIEGDTMERVKGIMAGLVVVVFSNLAPKTLEPLGGSRCSPARKQSLQRFSGWTLVLAGMGYSLAWLVLPLEFARMVAIVILASGVALVVARVAWFAMIRPVPQPSDEG
jgi:ABC-type antimicrobial peptide transport system permease subunit